MDLNERYKLGIEFINSNFTISNVFERIKNFLLQYLDEKDIKYLNECREYDLKIIDDRVSQIEFTFGEVWNLYKIKMDAFHFNISKQEEHSSFSKEIFDIATFKLKL